MKGHPVNFSIALMSSHELSILPVHITGITDIKTSAIYLLFVMVNNNKQQQQTVPANVTNIHKQVGSVLYTSILSTGWVADLIN